VEAFPDDTAPSYLLRDRDEVYGHAFRHRVKGMEIVEVLTAAHSPWQNPFVERLIGSVRRECLDHVLVLSERHLRRILAGYFTYYHRARTHLSPEKDAPDVRPIERPARGPIGKFPKSVACIIDMSGGRRKPASSGRPIATSATAVIVLPSGHRPSDPEVQVSCKSGLWPEEGDGPTLGQPPTGLLAGSSHAREYSPGDSDALLAKDRVCHVC
jgi:hypothetical protein